MGRPENKKEPRRAASSKPLDIMLVDDDNEILSTYAMFFEHEGWKVSKIDRCELALESLKKSRPDLVIADYLMPGMTGIEFVKQALKLYPDLNVFFISALEIKALVDMTFPEHQFRVFTKPISLDHLLRSIRSAIGLGPDASSSKKQSDEK